MRSPRAKWWGDHLPTRRAGDGAHRPETSTKSGIPPPATGTAPPRRTARMPPSRRHGRPQPSLPAARRPWSRGIVRRQGRDRSRSRRWTGGRDVVQRNPYDKAWGLETDGWGTNARRRGILTDGSPTCGQEVPLRMLRGRVEKTLTIQSEERWSPPGGWVDLGPPRGGGTSRPVVESGRPCSRTKGFRGSSCPARPLRGRPTD